MYEIKRISQCGEFLKYIGKIQYFLSDLVFEYPFHNIWFEGIVNELRYNTNHEREILYLTSDCDEIIGVSILKNTQDEKKICTLRVAKCFQGKGIGTLLVKKSCEILGTDKPIATVSQLKHREFIRLFQKFNFNLEHIYYGKYKESSIEYCYNGILLPESILCKEAIENHLTTSNHIA